MSDVLAAGLRYSLVVRQLEASFMLNAALLAKEPLLFPSRRNALLHTLLGEARNRELQSVRIPVPSCAPRQFSSTLHTHQTSAVPSGELPSSGEHEYRSLSDCNTLSHTFRKGTQYVRFISGKQSNRTFDLMGSWCMNRIRG